VTSGTAISFHGSKKPTLCLASCSTFSDSWHFY
jgi:hypothetical protein